MNARQLEAFKATMQTGSVTAAARRLHVSQPSISRLLADLERALGFALFLKSGRGLVPTVEAKEFFASVEVLFLGLDRLEEVAHAIRTTAGSEIRIAAIPSVASIELPKAVSRTYHANPDVRFMLHSRNTPAILEAVQTHQLDLGIVGHQPPYDGVEMLFHAQAPYVCLMPEDHPLLEEHGPLDLETLADKEHFATFGGAFPDEMIGLDRDLSARLKRNSRLSAANVPTTAALVREAGVLAIVDPFSAEQAVLMGGVAFRPICQKLHYHVAIVTAGRDHLSRAATRFAEQFATQLSRRIQDVGL